jgi:hypothetical protein
MGSLLKKIRSLFSSKQHHIYVVTQGVYKGEWLVRIKQDKDTSLFFSLPDKHIRSIDNKEIEWGLSNKVLEIGGVLPQDVYNVCLAEYSEQLIKASKNESKTNTSNRRKQHSTPGSLGNKQSR